MASLSRSRRAFWGDIRFLVGIALVLLSIAAVWLIVAAADDASPVLRAHRTITQGEALTSDDFQVVEVGLGALADDYLAPEGLEPGQVAARTIAEGELVPARALTAADHLRTTTVVIESGTGIPEDVQAGTAVEVWSAPLLEDGRTFDVPRILVADAVVREVRRPEGVLADTRTSLEVVIGRADVADVLAAVTGGATLSVVPWESGE